MVMSFVQVRKILCLYYNRKKLTTKVFNALESVEVEVVFQKVKKHVNCYLTECIVKKKIKGGI